MLDDGDHYAVNLRNYFGCVVRTQLEIDGRVIGKHRLNPLVSEPESIDHPCGSHKKFAFFLYGAQCHGGKS